MTLRRRRGRSSGRGGIAAITALLLGASLLTSSPAGAYARFQYGEAWGTGHESGTGGTWSADAALSHTDGSFSVSVAIDDPKAGVDGRMARASAEAYGYNLVTLDPGRYTVTAVLTGVQGAATESGNGTASISVLTGLGACDYRCFDASPYEHALVDSENQRTATGMVVATTSVVVIRQGTFNLVVTFVGDARDGVEVLDPYGSPVRGIHQGTASASISGVVDSVTVRRVGDLSLPDEPGR